VDKIEGHEDEFVNLDKTGVPKLKFKPGRGATGDIGFDPPHNLIHSEIQIQNGDMTGFAQVTEIFGEDIDERENAERVVKCFTPKTLPVLHELGKEFVVCDRWFSSVPGPTMANRMFLHAATSSGLASQPGPLAYVDIIKEGLPVENGTIFDRLERACLKWRVYRGDFPFVWLMIGPVKNLVSPRNNTVEFDAHFENDLKNADSSFPTYIHIEPTYWKTIEKLPGVQLPHSVRPNSHHPDQSTARAGERLVKKVYEAIRNSPIWEKSALIIVYDEGGGFFDHVEPPSAIPPGDDEYHDDLNSDDQPEAKQFKFDRLGFRVPALVISPFVEKGCVDHTIYDHASVVKMLTGRFRLRQLTERDKAANSPLNLFTRATPRADCPTVLPNTVGS